jgi:hypothetical protein
MKTTTLIVFFLTLTAICGAQKKYDQSREMGIAIGTSYYIGDVNPSKHFGTRLNPGGGLIYRHNFDRRLSLKASLLYGRIEAYDVDSDDAWQQNRNLSFRNDIFEGSLQGEINYFPYQIGDKRHPITPYLFAGLSIYKMKPQAEYKGQFYELQPLGTEGQGTAEGGAKYKTTGMSIPVGLGLKVNLFSIIGINLEWGMRRTFTDYFDDVSGKYVDPSFLADENGELSALLSDRTIDAELPDGTNSGLQRGDPGKKDWYSMAHLVISIKLGKSPTNCWHNIDFR